MSLLDLYQTDKTKAAAVAAAQSDYDAKAKAAADAQNLLKSAVADATNAEAAFEAGLAEGVLYDAEDGSYFLKTNGAVTSYTPVKMETVNPTPAPTPSPAPAPAPNPSPAPAPPTS
jgi:hypothetical protein